MPRKPSGWTACLCHTWPLRCVWGRQPRPVGPTELWMQKKKKKKRKKQAEATERFWICVIPIKTQMNDPVPVSGALIMNTLRAFAACTHRVAERKQSGAKCPGECQGREQTPALFSGFWGVGLKIWKDLFFFMGLTLRFPGLMCREELLIVSFSNYHSGTFVAM